MMSSVIPARLEFGCGHIALVSLPRLKGESAAKRTERVNNEKAGARGRSCDFCPRPDALVQERPAPDALASSGARNGHRPTPTTPTPLAPPEQVVAPAAATVAPPAPVVTPPPTAPVVTEVAATPVLATPRRAADTAPAAVVAVVPRRRRARAAVALAGVRAHRYEVRFAVETVIPATDMRAVLRRLESLGVRDVRSIAVTETS